MKYLQIVFLVVLLGCGNKKVYQNASHQISNEDFSEFYAMFFEDTVFQKERIILPLKGNIKTWVGDSIKEDTWVGKDIVVTAKEVFVDSYSNLKTDLIDLDSIYIEKYWLDQSGFIIEREYVRNNGLWYLSRYDISNL